MKRWTRILILSCLAALFCATLAAADFHATPLNCHEMAALMFGQADGAELLSGNATEAALSAYFDAREAAYRGDVRLLSDDDTPDMSADVAGNNSLRAERVREMESRLGFAVLDADVTARVDRDRIAQNPDGTRTFYVYEWTYYDYDDLSNGEGGLDVSGFGTWHILTVAETSGGGFEILADEYDESDILGLDTLSETNRRELESLGLIPSAPEETPVEASEPKEDAASLLAISYYPEYNADAAVAYSEQYWGGFSDKTYKEGEQESSNANYNPAYYNFNTLGGDCANFTSQSIAAGGMPQVKGASGWYYTDKNHVASAWISSTNMRRWMGENRGRPVSNAAKKDIFKGSPVFYSEDEGKSFRHTVLCVGTNSAGTPIINSHNNNRWHAIWNYFRVSGKAIQIDTVQLTSQSFGSFSGYVKLDADFHAYIVNSNLKDANSGASVVRYVSHDGNGNVSSHARTEQADQVWRFIRQADGSYEILSAKLDTLKTPALATVGGSGESRTYVCAEEYSVSSSQQWYLYQNGGADGSQTLYQLRPKCSDRVLDIYNASPDEGTKLWIFTRQTDVKEIGAQLFQIEETDWVTLDVPVLQVDLAGTQSANVRLFWDPVANADSYALVIKQNGAQIRSTTSRNTSYATILVPGLYEATVEAISSNGRNSSISEPLVFTVPTSYPVTYSANGGENPPEEQLKLQNEELTLSDALPSRTGYNFTKWNTEANGTGDPYASGAIYAKDEPLSLYAQWTPCEYTVTFDPGEGNMGEQESEIVVKYKELYGELPKPTLKDNAFIGWYTEPEGAEEEGELITAENSVTLTENHTLYAHWESTIAKISSAVTKTGDYYIVQTTAQNIPEGSVLIACGYLNGQFVTLDRSSVGEESDITLEGELDTIHVMALNNMENPKPLCPRATIRQQQFH